jgi:hypothetical protein
MQLGYLQVPMTTFASTSTFGPGARFILAAAALASLASALAHAEPKADEPAKPKPFTQNLACAAFKFDMVPVPGDEAKGVKPFYIAATELTWDAFDAYAYGLDAGGSKEDGAPEDEIEAVQNPPAGFVAVSRPSKPYLPPDRGYGHEGYAAICVSGKNATEFCKWLSVKTGRHYRLPTVAEWEVACRGGSKGKFCFGDDASQMGEYAWFAANSENKPHHVATKKPNAYGIFDMHGNVLEWCAVPGGKPLAMGGCYRDGPELLTCSSSQLQDATWNSSDPQIPKSKWWLSDGSFVGFRVACDAAEGERVVTEPAPNAKPADDKAPAPSDK